MREITKFKGLKPAGAKGRVCIDLKDPDTMKVKERIQGKNHVFEESLMSGSSFDWVTAVSTAWLNLNNSPIPIDTSIPYLFGSDIVGYGVPSMAGLGMYRGAYNEANQILAQISLDSVFWRFQYDFTTAQANGTPINMVGLTNQYDLDKQILKGYKAVSNVLMTYTNDGRYTYECSAAGIVTKTDMYTSIIQNINISYDIGDNTSDGKTIGYSPKNGKYYVYVRSTTAVRRKFYEYSDSNFNNLLTTYDISNVDVSSVGYPLYIYNNKAYSFSEINFLYTFDFVNNIAHEVINIPLNGHPEIGNNTIDTKQAPCPLSSRYILCGGRHTSRRKAIIFDLLTEQVVAILSSPGNYASSSSLYKYPLFLHENVACDSNSDRCRTAITAYQLDTPFTKTSANAMTVTYELEVFW